MRFFAIGIEDAARELDGTAMLAAAVNISAAVRTAGKRRSAAGIVLIRCAMDSRRVASLMPSGSSIGSAKRLSQDTTQLRNGTGIQADAQVGSGKDRAASEKNGPSEVATEAVLLWGLMPGATGHNLIVS
jgi:hypothetical protein